ncbi:MAG: hypothetical protein M0027_15005 [Candidatus Dormibacteraeota bacterium]|nr:hypothetical protein [Candidatus Dormibacteraeota bacterium]
MNKATRPADARTILRQIGDATLQNLGARQMVDRGDGLHFTVGRSAGRTLRKVVILLAADDTYTVEALKFDRRTFESTTTYEIGDVYAESLALVVRIAGRSVGVFA